MNKKKYARALTIAGSDSGGGAGIQADLKTFSALGCYGMSVVTAITAQNTVAVTAIQSIPPAMVASQIDAVITDIGVDAVKIGMLQTPQIIETVARYLQNHSIKNIVIDPVMIAKSGDKLLNDDAVTALQENLLPLALLITPNIPEAEVLLGRKIDSRDAMTQVAQDLINSGFHSVLLKGGHLDDPECPDLFLEKGGEPQWVVAPRIETQNTHGTGCSLSSAITARLAHGSTLHDAVTAGISYIKEAISAGAEYELGKGHGPVHHFYKFW